MESVIWLVLLVAGPAADDFVDLENPPAVIVPASKGAAFYHEHDAQAFFTPSRSQIARLEARIERFLKTAGYVPDDLYKRARIYRRQYVGIIVNGKRKIWVNLLCEAEPGWRRRPYRVHDGGDCYFRVTYDPKTGEFSDFNANGEA